MVGTGRGFGPAKRRGSDYVNVDEAVLVRIVVALVLVGAARMSTVAVAAVFVKEAAAAVVVKGGYMGGTVVEVVVSMVNVAAVDGTEKVAGRHDSVPEVHDARAVVEGKVVRDR